MNLPYLLGNRKIQVLVLLVLVCAGLMFLRDGNPATVDLNLGIEFAGGTRIPISLEKPLDAGQMTVMIDTIKARINKFGLTQAVVRPLGNKEILVELPQAQAEVIKSVEGILREQGQFEAIIGGRQALNGSDIIPTGIGGANGELIQDNGQWQLTFSVTAEGNLKFATAASGHRGESVYMFLDRPQKTALLVFQNQVPESPIVREALAKQDDDIGLFYVEEFNRTQNELLAGGYQQIRLSKNLSAARPDVFNALVKAGFQENASAEKHIKMVSDEELRPALIGSGLLAGLSEWKAIGLQSAPTLQFDPIVRAKIEQYQITGQAEGLTAKELKDNAGLEIRQLKSVLSGGRLPVAASVGSYYNVAPSLGNQFLAYSFYGMGAALFLVAIVVTLYYRRIKLVIPIMLTLMVELFVIITLLGALGTLDLAAMAGVIALIGSSVDNQIVITDELLKKRGDDVTAKRKLKDAFYIVFTTAGLAAASMLPLLGSGIVEIMGFAVAALLSVMVGIAVTRPAYGAIVEETIFKNE
ncbi:hypothetical protein HY572_02135 [Candidatus Micrarchaeota archaeon]|nr:hypothetical protein [Candidatus Micrarchaeota archaeon]